MKKEDIDIEKNTIDYYISLWENLNKASLDVDSRNMGILNIGSLVAVIALIIANKTTEIKIFDYVVYFIPGIIMVAFFFNAFNNKLTAILKGYLSGLEEIINSMIGKNVFLWNSRFIHIYRMPYFLSNNTAGIMFFIFAFFLVAISFYEMFMKKSQVNFNVNLYLLFLVLYLLFFIVFSISFTIDTFSNGKTRKIAHDYFIENYKNDKFELPEAISKETLKRIYNSYKKTK